VPLEEDVCRAYLGGSGLGTRLLLDEGGATTDPLSPGAPLIFAFSPLVGTPLTRPPSSPSSAAARSLNA